MSRDLFPLASGLSKVVNPHIEALTDGQPTDLLNRVTDVTAELLKFWFQQDYCEQRQLNFHVGQRAAILNTIYAHEVVGAKRLRDLYEALAPAATLDRHTLSEVTRAAHNHPKYAAKMATGTGKTWVLNALLTWQYLNKIANPSDERFTSNFLVVAPGLIVYDRLLDSFLGKERDGERHFESSDIFSTSELFVPDNYRDAVFGFLQSSVVTKADIGRKVTGSGMIAVTNWHLLAGEEDPDFLPDAETPGVDLDPVAAVESMFPLTPGTAAGNSLDVLDRRFLRGGPLASLVELSDLCVFNDEAHHIHEIKRGGEITEVEWQRCLTEIASTKGHRFIQIDFSATPYNQVGNGKNAGRKYFPHIVVDFDLKQAINAGLVKALALDKRKEVAALPLDFKAQRDEQKRVVGLSNGQRVMLRAGLTKLKILEEHFATTDPTKLPKLLVVCEETSVAPHVVEFLKTTGLSDEDILAVDSNRKGEMPKREWERVRERLFDIDRHQQPKVIVSVLMLREGFDVNNICVIVPLRSSQAPILLEQTIGRGLRLMWRGDEQIDELKRETRERLRQRLEPSNHFDVLFIVEHPAFAQFYDDLLSEGLAGEVGDSGDSVNAIGDLIRVDLREEYNKFDISIPLVIRDEEEELRAPSLDPLSLQPCSYDLSLLKRLVGRGDRFVSEDAQTGTEYGDYGVDGGVMTATGYNDYLSRMTKRIAAALSSGITRSAKQYSEISRFPFLQTYRPMLTGWLDTYIRRRLFDGEVDPLYDENWRVLLIDDVAKHVAGVFASALVDTAINQSVEGAEVRYRRFSEVRTILVREHSAVNVNKCIYAKLPIPTKAGGLERTFIQWADSDSKVEALIKVHEYRHEFMRRPYLKADGMPGSYSPDFVVRTAKAVYIVETKAQSALSDENVARKQRAALSWVEQISSLREGQRLDRTWHYVLIGESSVYEWKKKGAQATDLLEYARIRPSVRPEQQRLGFTS
ncbi:MAG TPA: DEAD/DEAH box helicase family protein [Solirubrobacteraceae bacterium]|nr:DEAD/DEAH box helicase family protein [Solirubrobacteraceae bacterium]